MKCLKFLPLLKDMKTNRIDKEHYSFLFNNFKFDVILAIMSSDYEILVAIHSENWGCVLRMDENFNVKMSDSDYYSLRAILGLSWQENKFSSDKFLFLLSDKAPRKSSLQKIDYKEKLKYLNYRNVEEKDKIYFCGWNDHLKDGRRARNFDKTEFYFGNQVATYCRKHNISSLWSDIPRDEKIVTNPWSK